MTTPDERRARRVWIAAHHPDRGGDPRVFAAGLAAFARADAEAGDRPGEHPSGPPTGPRATVVRSRGPVRTLRRLARRVTRARRRRTHHVVL